MSLADAVTGGRRAGLEALRDRLAEQIDGCDSARDVAALSARLIEVLSQLDALESAVESERVRVSPLSAARDAHAAIVSPIASARRRAR